MPIKAMPAPDTISKRISMAARRKCGIYDAFLAMLEEFGPVIVLPEKTRIAFQVRMSFAQLTVRRDWVLGHLVLARRRRVRCSRRSRASRPATISTPFASTIPPEVEELKGMREKPMPSAGRTILADSPPLSGRGD
jgi:hypothetical protein